MKHGGDIYSHVDSNGNPLIFLDYSSNINPNSVSASFLENIGEALENLTVYPDIKYRALKDNILEYLKMYPCYFEMGICRDMKDLKRENIVVGNGAAEILDLAVSFLNSITIVVPSFVEYEEDALKHNVKISYSYKDKNFDYDYEDILSKVKSTEGLIIASPNNPDGGIINKDKFLPILKYCEKNNKVIIIDEAFIEFTGDGEDTLIDYINDYSCLIIVRAITKFYSMPGIRLGFGVTNNEKLLTHFEKFQNPWNVNCFAEVAAKYIFKDKEFISKSISWITNERSWFYEELRKNSLIDFVSRSKGNYFLCRLKGISGSELYEEFQKRNILIRTCSNYKGLNDSYVRFAIKDRNSNKKFFEAFKDIESIYVYGGIQ